MKLTFNVNAVIQVLGTAVHVLNMSTNLFPDGSNAKATVLLVTALVQSAFALVSHFKNPDGTPASEPFNK